MYFVDFLNLSGLWRWYLQMQNVQIGFTNAKCANPIVCCAFRSVMQQKNNTLAQMHESATRTTLYHAVA